MSNSTSLRSGLRVLLVDSELDSTEMLATLFAQYEVETITATCASEALETLQQVQPDLLISEIILPNEDGYSLMRQVRTFETNYEIRIPAIALTVCVGERDRLQALAAGFCKHLPKPVNFEDLMATVADLTQLPEAVSTRI